MGTTANPELMTQAEYARHRHKSRQYIGQLAKAGVLVMRGGKVDVRASDVVLDDRPVDDVEVPSRPAPPMPAPAPHTHGDGPYQPTAVTPSRAVPESLGQTSTSFGQARTIEMVFRAKLRRLEFETRQGKLIEADVVRRAIATAVRAMRDGILGLPDRLATVLAAESDAKKIHVTLKTELSRELEALADAINAI